MTDDDIRKAFEEWFDDLRNKQIPFSFQDVWQAAIQWVEKSGYGILDQVGYELKFRSYESKPREGETWPQHIGKIIAELEGYIKAGKIQLAQSSKREKRAVEFIKRMASSVDPLSGICEVCQTASCNHYDARIFLDYKLQGKEDQPTDEGVET